MNLTERQIKSIQAKIQRIKKALADDKKHWGGQYHDGRGLRYLPPEQYLKLQDYSGAQRYFNWFHKNFPDDSGYPDFLFEWTITLFYCGKLKEAEKKAITTHLSNQYYFDKYFNKPIVRLEKRHYSNLEYQEMAESFAYTSTQEHLAEFTKWLEQFVKSDKFTTIVTQYNELEEQLSKESDVPRRSKMINQMHKIKYSEE
ncbi:hypothetical protein AGMMS50239_04590 [Bacteroidia bacterium]|nr:hypothetical protein AGMMS50239_04590 [Bacteroidia bacterium]